MKKLYLIILLLALTLNLHAQTPSWIWAKSAGGIFSEEATSIAVDALGNTYITGFFTSPTCTFGSTTLTNISFADIFIAKYDTLANLVWVKSAGGLADDKSKSIAVDTSGNVYITGYFNSATITFDTVTLATTFGNDMFIAKYNASGNVVWAKNAGGTGGDYSNSIAVDASGNSFITGYFNSANIQFGSTTLVNPNSSSGGYNYFVAKYDTIGNPVWAKAALGANVTGNSIKLNAAGNIYVSGFFMGSATFDTIAKNSNGSKDIFTAKYDTFGNAIWVKSIGGINEEIGNAISIDANDNSYVTGYFNSLSVIVGGTTLTNNGAPNGDVLIIKYDETGNVMWAKKALNYSNDMGLAIAADALGNSFVSGYYNGSSLIFGSIALNAAAATTSVGDLFVVKYNTAGTPLWAKNLVASTGARGHSIALDAAGNCYLTGFFEDVSLPFDNITLLNGGSQGQREVFVGKIGTSTSVGLIEKTENNVVVLYPNPTCGNLIININTTSKTQIEILNLLGECMYKTTTISQQTSVDLSQFVKGIYVVKTTDINKNVMNKKIVLQ